MSATATSGLAVTFTARRGQRRHLHLSGSTVTFVSAGTCTINADQAGNGTYLAAPQVQQSFVISAAPAPSVQSINFTSTEPSSATVGGSDYTVTATASSGLAVTFTIAARRAPASARSPARQSRSSAQAPARSTRTRAAMRATRPRRRCSSRSRSPSRRRRSASPPGRPAEPSSAARPTPCRRPRRPAWQSPSPATAGSAGICTLTGSTVTMAGAGTCTINANQAGNGTYLAAAQVQQSLPSICCASPGTQSITFTSTAPAGAAVGGTRTRSRRVKLRSRRQLLDRRVERRRLHDLRVDGLLHRHRHLQDRREPGWQRRLPGRTASAADIRGRPSRTRRSASRPVRPAEPSLADRRTPFRRPRALGLPVAFTIAAGSQACAHLRWLGHLVYRCRHVHDQREPGR